MAYADRNDSGPRWVAIGIVALIHVVIGYAFVTGLAYQYVKKVSEKLNTFDVAPPPPPPPPDEPPPPPPPDQPLTPPPVVSPPPIVQNPNPPQVQIQTVQTPPPAIVFTPKAAPPAPPAPPAPAAPRISQAAGARGNPREWVSQDDYPASALRAEAQGTTAIAWTINAQGKVENCRVTSSSGNRDLDDAACRAISRRGKYTPAKDQDGNPIASSDKRNVVWRLPEE